MLIVDITGTIDNLQVVNLQTCCNYGGRIWLLITFADINNAHYCNC
jgi:hypothetical protein